MNEVLGIIDELIYRSYRYNRQRTPELTPESWGKVFNNASVLEERLQIELQNTSKNDTPQCVRKP